MRELIGRRLGDYHILARLGQGGMGIVYQATSVQHEAPVAVKILAPHLSRDEVFVKRFWDEYQTVRSLRHRNIVQVYEFGTAHGYYYIASEYVDGQSLAEYLAIRSHLTLPVTVRLVGQIAAALDAAHQRGIVHRDLKPSNVLLDRQGRVLLADFGIASMWNRETRMQGTRHISGTFDYMSPEQIRGIPFGHQADIYALGVLTYQMLTGHVPFQRENPWAVLHAHVYETPPPLAITTRTPSISSAVDRVVGQALSKKPAERQKHAGNFAHQLALAAGVSMTVDGKTTESGGYASSRILWGVVLACIAVMIVVLGIFSTRLPNVSSAPDQFPAGELAYSCGAEGAHLCLQSSQDSREVILRDRPAWTPAWSPNGRVVAFSSLDDGRGAIGIWVLDLDTQVLRQLKGAELGGDAWSPTWSPDGTRLACDVTIGDTTDIYVISGWERDDSISFRQLTARQGRDSDPAWSPAGDAIAFVSDRDDDLEIYLMSPDGEVLRRLTHHEGRDFAPAWSPNGESLVYECEDAYENDVEICVLDLSSYNRTVLTRNAVDDRQPVWTPDGASITFSRQRSGELWDIWIMDKDGQNAYALVQDQFSSTHPTWRP
jgi:serine/threonine protein kinase/Tol biopolymer transport system component